ncbi:MAG: hypothetical protein KGN79_03160 [Acidobacteriota bacterium]|nr:hypothetical protein [Acidobacteriota bacterium]
MKRKSFLSLFAAAMAMISSLAAIAQVAPDKPVAEPTNGPVYKYEAFAGFGYTSINQVNQSRSGLIGAEGGVRRDWGKYFGINAMYGYYAWAATQANPGNPKIDMILLGPELHAPLYGRVSGSIRSWFGTAHMSNIPIQPDYSFAGGVGIGLDYALNNRLSLRLAGDDIGSAFTVVPYVSGSSTHTRFNAHATFGVAYKF